jgi:hypothetical protein
MKLVFTCFLLFTGLCSAQDERYYRELFTSELFQSSKEEFLPKLVVRTSLMKQDLNRDGLPEGIIVSKRDGQDWIHLLTRDGKVFFEERLIAKGTYSQLFKIVVKSISKNTDALILYFYEGAHDTADFLASARLYFITIDNRDFSTTRMARGPYFFVEKEKGEHHYWNRHLHVNINDFNLDGTKEVSVSYNGTQRIYSYEPKKGWVKF